MALRDVVAAFVPVTDVIRRGVAMVGLRPAGWFAVAMAVVCAILGTVTRWHELRLAALMVALLCLVALLFTLGRPTFDIELSVPDTRVVVGDEASGTVAITNSAQRRNLPVRVDLPIGSRAASFPVPSLASGGFSHERFIIPTDKRQVVVVGPATTVQADPFSFAGRETKWSEEVEVFVHPKTVLLEGHHIGYVHDLEGSESTMTTASDMNFQSLREYTPGDDRRQVHWKSSARTGALMVRQYDQTRRSDVALGVDLTPQSYLGDADFEDVISVAASVAIHAFREQNPLQVFVNDRRLTSVSGVRALDELTRVERDGEGGVRQLITTMMRLAPRASVVFVVTGAACTLDEMRRACATLPLDTRVVGISVDPDTSVSVRILANVALVSVRSLADLPGAMVRAMA